MPGMVGKEDLFRRGGRREGKGKKTREEGERRRRRRREVKGRG